MTGAILGMIAGFLGVVVSVYKGNFDAACWAFISLVWAFTAAYASR